MQRQIAKPDTREVKERPARFEGWGKYILVGAVFLGIVGYGSVNAIRHRAHPDSDRSYVQHRNEADRNRDEAYRNRNMNYRAEAEAKNKADAGMDE